MSGTQHAELRRRPSAPTGDVAEPVLRTATPTLVVGDAFDPAEHEADQVADRVIARLRADGAGPAPAHEHDGGCSHGVQRVATTTDAPVVGSEGGALPGDVSSAIESRRGRGSALPTPVRTRMESAFGADLGNVTIHTDQTAATLSRTVSAKAFTTGSDIFFGAGQFRPDTADGEHMIAHELAHTRQRGGVQRKTIHRVWDFSRPVDWGKVRTIATVTSGQPVYFLNDGTETAVVKAEESQIGVAQMSSDLLERIGGIKSVKHTKIPDGERVGLTGVLADTTKWNPKSLSALGKHKRTTTELDNSWWSAKKKELGDKASTTMSDQRVGELFVTESVPYMAQSKWMAMSEAAGATAGKAAATKEHSVYATGQMESKFRRMMRSMKHNENLGVLTAMDLFMGNSDRVMLGNVGNWFYDDADGITAIDHVDRKVEDLSRKYTVDHKELARLASGNLATTAKDALDGLTVGMMDTKMGNDPDFKNWLDANGGIQRTAVEEGLERGLRKGRERLIKVFNSTRFSGKRADRKIKKQMKKSAQSALAQDREDDDRIKDDPNQYYAMLKGRAKWLKDN